MFFQSGNGPIQGQRVLVGIWPGEVIGTRSGLFGRLVTVELDAGEIVERYSYVLQPEPFDGSKMAARVHKGGRRVRKGTAEKSMLAQALHDCGRFV